MGREGFDQALEAVNTLVGSYEAADRAQPPPPVSSAPAPLTFL
jgi:hypothetical protein